MLVKEAMSRDVKTVNSNQALQEAAKIMLDIDAGALPVGENDRLVGILALADLATVAKTGHATAALSGISQAGGAHSQSHSRE